MAALLAKGWTRPVVFTQPRPAIPSEQLALFPRKTILELGRNAGEDIYQYVQADNKRNYYLKLDRPGRYVRASEWLSYRLAHMVGISTPRCDFIQTFDGDIAFGSEDIGDVAAQIDTVRYLQTGSLNEFGKPLDGLQSALSAIHAFDLFVNNIDRHYKNFLVVGKDDERHLIALDFARSLFWDWPISGFPGQSDLTSEVWIELRERHGFDLGSALAIVDRLGIVTPAQILSMANQMPSHWLPQSIHDDLAAYCGDGAWGSRVAELRRGLEDGSII